MAATPEIRENADGTVDLIGVEILSAGGPVHGVGSPPEGDFWSRDELELIAAANRELADEVKGPNKLGHSDVQALLENSGVKPVTAGEMPAVGWLDGASFEVGERDGVAKLFADVRAVPAKVADLIVKKAYRTRSVELSRVTSQSIIENGKPKVYDWVITGLAWLGAKMPAVRTLDDIVALYEDQHLAAPEGRCFVFYAEGAIVWEPELGFQDLRDDVAEALNGPPTGGMNEPRFWVCDIATTLDKALVQDYLNGGDDGWVVPFTRGADDKITIAPSADWTPVEQGWVEAAREFEQRVTVRNRRADIRRDMPETTKSYTDDQRRKFAEATGMELDKVTDEMLETAGVPVEETEPKKDLEADERFRSLEQTAKAADERSRKLETELHAERRRNFVEGLVKDCKIEPGDTEKWEKRYDADPEAARSYAADLKVDEDLLRELGSDEENLDDDALEAQNKSYEDDAATRLGIDREAII